MSAMTRDVLDALKVELAFLDETDGLGLSPFLKQGSIFRNSPICPNFGYGREVQSCDQCPLMAFVPVEHRSENLPCHHIPLVNGESIATMEMGRKQYQLC